MKELILKHDPFELSIKYMLAIIFPKSSSPTYNLALNIAQGAIIFEQLQIETNTINLVAFDFTKADAGRAQVLLKYSKGWKGVQVFCNGEMMDDNRNILKILHCYSQALSCRSQPAHCFHLMEQPGVFNANRQVLNIAVFDGLPVGEEISVYQHPCKMVHNILHTDHPATIQDQIQAGAVEFGCDWCPLFDTKNFKQVSTTVKTTGVI